jgi:hypothetical protein
MALAVVANGVDDAREVANEMLSSRGCGAWLRWSAD